MISALPAAGSASTGSDRSGPGSHTADHPRDATAESASPAHHKELKNHDRKNFNF
jgi:hypothetical protein